MAYDEQTASSAPADAAPSRPLDLSALRKLVNQKWRNLPGATLVILSSDPEGDGYSPFAEYERARYAPTDVFVGDVFPLKKELEEDEELRELYDHIPNNVVPALVLYPLG